MLINEIAKLSGVTARTLRYYDEIGLLKPSKVWENGYRHYSQEDIDRLQQILFYRELDFKLEKIKMVLDDPNFDIKVALQEQQTLLQEKRNYFDDLIDTIKKTIQSIEGGITMTNEQKFEKFKEQLINENEQKFGQEIREKYGEDEILSSYGKIKNMTEEQYEAAQQLESQLFIRLKEAMEQGNVKSETSMEVVELHKRWLSFYWTKYTKDAHVGLAQMYINDERFIAYYNGRVGNGATLFLHDAIMAYSKL